MYTDINHSITAENIEFVTSDEKIGIEDFSIYIYIISGC